jgi:hypothetical protein
MTEAATKNRRGKAFSPDEVLALERLYPAAPRCEVMAAIPDRTWDTIRATASDRGISRKWRGGHPDPGSSWRSIVIAAFSLPSEFSLPDLVVAAWQQDRKAFGLRGHEDRHPDSKRVEVALYHGKRGLIARGALRRQGKGRFSLVRGNEWVRMCLTQEGA